MTWASRPGEGNLHGNCKLENKWIESDHAALKKLTTPPVHGSKWLSSDKATFRGLEAIRTIHRGPVLCKQPDGSGETRFVKDLFEMEMILSISTLRCTVKATDPCRWRGS